MNQQTDPAYIGRFAPSPSGPLHFGSLVAALGSYLDARKHNGLWLLRIEDIDPPREKAGASADILRTLEAFGFQWDGEILYQSKRRSAYETFLERLLEEKLAYPCNCSRKEIASAGLFGIEGSKYPGTCREGVAGTRDAIAIRLRSDHPHEIAFEDRICGPIRQSIERDIGDFIIRRSDGIFAYQFAVVIDDAYQGINQVVRGADLLLSTPRQILLQERLGLPTPDYAHLPLVLGEDGKKLSKQSDAHPVSRTHPLEALIAAYRFLGQGFEAGEVLPASLDEFWAISLSNWDSSRVPCNHSLKTGG